MSEKKWVVYLVRCDDNSLYCGVSNDIKSRLIEHNSGKGAKYTRSRRPVELVGVGPQMSKSEALKLEYWIKRLPYDQKIFEFLVLEGAQAGLSWTTILKRRQGYRKAFSNFDVDAVAKYNKKHIEKLLKDDSIIKNNLKINSAINNAKQFLKIQKEFGSFDSYIWRFVNNKPVKNKFKKLS